MSDDHWFAPKRFGLGATPVTWQGWSLTAGFVALIWATTRAHQPGTRIGLIVALTLAYLAIVAAKTRGGLRWHWRREE